MNRHRFSHGTEQKLAALVQRVDRNIEECRRFEEMAAHLNNWAERWPTQALIRRLESDNSGVEEREEALVALAIRATEEAGRAIAAYDPGECEERHRIFWDIAQSHWQKRYEQRGARQSSGAA